MSVIYSSTLSFLTDFKWSSRCGCCSSLADSSVCGCFCKNMLWLTIWFLFACEWTFAEGQNSNTSKSICYKTLIDNCSPGLSGKSRAMQLHCRFTRHLLIQYSRRPCLPVIQTACLACVTAVGISNFTPCHQIKRAAGAGGSQDRVCSSNFGSCVNHPAWLSSEQPRGVLLLSDGLALEPWSGRIWITY